MVSDDVASRVHFQAMLQDHLLKHVNTYMPKTIKLHDSQWLDTHYNLKQFYDTIQFSSSFS